VNGRAESIWSRDTKRESEAIMSKSKSNKVDVKASAAYVSNSANVKLSKTGKGVDATYASIKATCPKDCKLRDSGCYSQTGNTFFTVKRLDETANGKSGIMVAKEEAFAIDNSYRGKKVPDGQLLRIHVSGDCTTNTAAKKVSAAANRWLKRGGKRVWSYTHAWRNVKRESWGKVNVLASMESPKDGMAAIKRGYAPALVVGSFTNDKAFVADGIRWIPCPAQTKDKVTCQDCKLCHNVDKLVERNAGIAFAVHGVQKNKAKRHLTVL